MHDDCLLSNHSVVSQMLGILSMDTLKVHSAEVFVSEKQSVFTTLF